MTRMPAARQTCASIGIGFARSRDANAVIGERPPRFADFASTDEPPKASQIRALLVSNSHDLIFAIFALFRNTHHLERQSKSMAGRWQSLNSCRLR